MSTEPKSNHRVNVVRINEVLPHSNADTLGIIQVGGYQVVTKLGTFHRNELAIYIQPDSVVPEIPQFSFLWDGQVPPQEVVPERRRRITVRKFRKEYSEGLLMPLSDFWNDDEIAGLGLDEGTDVAELLGITHYEPPEPGESTQTTKRRRGRPKTLKGWLHYLWYLLVQVPLGLAPSLTGHGNELPPKGDRHVYDVESYKNFKGTFEPGEIVTITEKIHGSNARYTNEPRKPSKIFAGSRRLWKSPESGNVWRRVLARYPYISSFLEDNPGFTLYGEAVPTQGSYTYGATPEAPKFFLFDVMDTERHWLGDDWHGWMDVSWEIERVPLLYIGPWSEDLIAKYVDGPSLVSGANHIREGIVIRAKKDRIVRGLGRPQLKVVSNKFLEKE